MRSAADYRELLRSNGLRATGPRVAVLGVLEQHKRPLTHGEVADELGDSGFDRATLYRNLMDMTETGLLHRTDYGDHVWRFELTPAEGAHTDDGHPHFICKACGTVECLPREAVAIHATRKSPKAVRRRGVQVELRGLCDAC
ncbi:MAG TPA: transcriptional repressor, partial [Polyangiaceae bacterium]